MSSYQDYSASQMAREKMAEYQAEAARARLLKQVIPSLRVRVGRLLMAVGRRLIGDSAGLELKSQ